MLYIFAPLLLNSHQHKFNQIVTTSLHCTSYFCPTFQRLTGNQNVGFNNAVFLSERDTADRNYAM